MEQALLRIYRQKSFCNALYLYTIYLNSEKLTQIRQGEQIEYLITPDIHHIHCQFLKGQSETIIWEATPESTLSLRCISKGPSIPSLLKNLKIVLPLLVIWGIGCLYSKAFYSEPVCLIVFFIVCLTLYGNLSLGIWRHQQKYGSQVLFLIADPNETEPFTVSPSAQASRKEPVWQHICLAIVSSIVLTVIYNTFM